MITQKAFRLSVLAAALVSLPLQAAATDEPFHDTHQRPHEERHDERPSIEQLLHHIRQLEQQVAKLQDQVKAFGAITQYVSVETVNGQPAVRVSGANLQVVNGLGSTATANALGNLIIGYDEADFSGRYHCTLGSNPNSRMPVTDEAACTAAGGQWLNTGFKTGSHYLVAGAGNNYSRWGGLVAGQFNTSNFDFASVGGGALNTASGWYSSVSGGIDNKAAGNYSSVSGGHLNTANNEASSVSGGSYNTASGRYSSVSGGTVNTASGGFSSVSGGVRNTASGSLSSVSGGYYNTASNYYSSVSGGYQNAANGEASIVCGGSGKTASGDFSVACTDTVLGVTTQDAAPPTQTLPANPELPKLPELPTIPGLPPLPALP